MLKTWNHFLNKYFDVDKPLTTTQSAKILCVAVIGLAIILILLGTCPEPF